MFSVITSALVVLGFKFILFRGYTTFLHNFKFIFFHSVFSDINDVVDRPLSILRAQWDKGLLGVGLHHTKILSRNILVDI